MTASGTAGKMAIAASAAALLLAVCLVWLPEIRLYWIGFPDVDTRTVLAARRIPSPQRLAEIGSQVADTILMEFDDGDRRPETLANLAIRILLGEEIFPGPHALALPFPFRASHLDAGLPAQQLSIAGMGATYTLLQAYHATEDERFLTGALQEALAFDDVDRWRLVPRGLLWNDHALAMRIPVLADLWLQMRTRPELDERLARRLLELADRTAARLAKPELYNFRTNHGVMQSVALLQASAAFPTLDRAQDYRNTGCARLVEQFRYYIDSDGITLEHSPGYHELGRRLLSLALRLSEVNACPIPSDWRDKALHAHEFSRLLARPDRSLPVIGNTDHAPFLTLENIDVEPPPPRAFSVYPTAGFSIAWRGLANWPDPMRLAQTVATWSNFPSLAHKHADDLAITVWAAGRPWLTNAGYWPYDVEGYYQANGWRGSNAPHVDGEAATSDRKSALVGVADGLHIRLLDIERHVVGKNISFRRQVVEIDGTWIIVDAGSGPIEGKVASVWTTMPETGLQRLGDGEYLLQATDVPVKARISFLGNPTVQVAVKTGEMEPFAGWIVRAGQAIPAPSFDVRQGSPGLAVTVLSLGNASEFVPALESGAMSVDNWRLTLRSSTSTQSIQRAGNRVHFANSSIENEVAEIGLPPTDTTRQQIVDAFDATARAYPRHRDLTYYRWKLSWLMVGLLLMQELVIFALHRVNRGAARVVRVAAAPAWIAFGLFAFYVYLQ